MAIDWSPGVITSRLIFCRRCSCCWAIPSKFSRNVRRFSLSYLEMKGCEVGEISILIYRLFNTARNFDSWFDAELFIYIFSFPSSSLNKINSDRIEKERGREKKETCFLLPFRLSTCYYRMRKKNREWESKCLLSIDGREEGEREKRKICSNYILLSTESKPYGNEYDSPTNLIRRKTRYVLLPIKHQSFQEENSLFALDLLHHYGWKEIVSDRWREGKKKTH